MPKKEVNKLMKKMKEQVGTAPVEPKAPALNNSDGELSLTRLEVGPYKRGNAWPGRNYMLVGNSFNVEQKIMSTAQPVKRSACIAMMLEQGGARRCVFVHEALQNEGFLEVLSKFERSWMVKLPEDTVIGPAYAPTGELIGQSFAVWRKIKVVEPARQKKNTPERTRT